MIRFNNGFKGENSISKVVMVENKGIRRKHEEIY